jgi:hypothetical protein
MVKNKPPDGWFEILEACRKLAKNGTFTSADLVAAVRFTSSGKSTPAQIASGWLGKFAKWGYLERGEPMPRQGEVGRPMTPYKMTELGETCTERPGRLTRLLKHIRAIEKARGTKDEGPLYAELFTLADEIEDNKIGER